MLPIKYRIPIKASYARAKVEVLECPNGKIYSLQGKETKMQKNWFFKDIKEENVFRRKTFTR